MDSNTHTSYQDDILKVKQIWNDLKQVGKPSQKKVQTSKGQKRDQKKNKANQGSKHRKYKDQAIESKSEMDLNKRQAPEGCTIITFSTKKSHPTPDQPHSVLSPLKPQSYLKNFNQRAALQQKELELSHLRVDNKRLKDQVDRLQKQIQQKEELIARYKKREDELLGLTRRLSGQKIEEIGRGAEYMNYKSDTIRLLKMLEQTEEYNYFAKMALDDEGVRRLGMTGKKSRLDLIDPTNSKQNPAISKQKPDKRLHFCCCNQQFIPQEKFWVPSKVYDFSRNYIKQHKYQELTEAEIELLLYDLNKIWRERQKRIVNWLKAENAHEVGKYKRKFQTMKRDDKGQLRQ